jgi:hypothetical protein
VVEPNACSLALFRSRAAQPVSQTHSLKGSTRLKLTIDSTDALEDTLRVVGAMYNVSLEVSANGAARSGSDRATGNGTSASGRSTRGTRGGARRRPGNRTTSKREPSKRERNGQAHASSGSDGGVSTAAVRTWARENGYTVADRGRVPTDLITAYRNAQPA